MHLETRVLVTGGAGFLGSHLCERLLKQGANIICVDNYFTGARRNIETMLDHHRFELIRHDVTFPLYLEIDQIYNLACPASPIHYQHDPVQTTKTSVHGAINMLGLAKRVRAKILRPRRPRFTAIPASIRKARIIGAMSIRSARARATTKASAAPKPCSLIIGASINCPLRSRGSSTLTDRACTPTTAAWYRTLSCRPCWDAHNCIR